MTITHHDLEQLIREPSPRVRSHIAAKVSESFNRTQFTTNETKLAIEIFRLLLRDTAISVRRAIAENLKHSAHLPRDIVLTLAADDAEIAVPILECSALLSDDDLIELVATTREIRKWLAISRRREVSRSLSHRLIETGSDEVAVSLLGNDGADIAEDDIEQVLDAFRGDQDVLEALVCRGGLPLAFAERLHVLVGVRLRKQLTRRYHLPWNLVGGQLDSWRETSMLRFLTPRMSDGEIDELVSQMHRNRRLSDRLVIRALLAGEMRFTAAALSERADIPRSGARSLLADRGSLGFRTLYLAAGMPSELLEPLDVVRRFIQRESAVGRPLPPDFAHRLSVHLQEGGHEASLARMGEIMHLLDSGGDEPRVFH